MNYMNGLFETWLVSAKDTPEADAVMQKFCADDDENYDLIVNFIEAVSRQGFEAGFDCAVQLLKMENIFQEKKLISSHLLQSAVQLPD